MQVFEQLFATPTELFPKFCHIPPTLSQQVDEECA